MEHQKEVLIDNTKAYIDGKFAIEAEPNKTLVISMVGYDAQEVAAGKNIKVTMKAIEDADYFSDDIHDTADD